MQGSFRVDVRRVRSKIGESVTRRAERVTQRLVDAFIADSPVDTGSFRASWNVSEGYPEFKVVNGGSTEAPLGPPFFVVKAKSHFPVFFITNGQPYGQMLEHGWSHTQAPYGIVRVNIAGLY